MIDSCANLWNCPKFGTWTKLCVAVLRLLSGTGAVATAISAVKDAGPVPGGLARAARDRTRGPGAPCRPNTVHGR